MLIKGVGFLAQGISLRVSVTCTTCIRYVYYVAPQGDCIPLARRGLNEAMDRMNALMRAMEKTQQSQSDSTEASSQSLRYTQDIPVYDSLLLILLFLFVVPRRGERCCVVICSVHLMLSQRDGDNRISSTFTRNYTKCSKH